MNLHEYQGKQLFAEYGLPVTQGVAAKSADEAVSAADVIGGDKWMVKVQVHAGGRGKAGGVKLASSKSDILEFADKWLGKRMITYQTGPEGQPVSCILVEAVTEIMREIYLGAVVDRSSRRVVFMASTEGGVEIEKVARETPDKILKATIDPMTGAQAHQGRELAFQLGLEGSQIKQFVEIFMGLAKMFRDRDLSLLEINPLVLTVEGNIHCLDANSGKVYWTHDSFSRIWGSTLVVDGKLILGNEDGDLLVMNHGKTKPKVKTVSMGAPVYSSPVVSNGVLYVGTQTHLYAIGK